MTMTLEQMLEVLRNACDEKHAIGSSMCGALADAVDAHIAAIREVIAELRDYDDSAFNVWADKLEAALQESKP
jgi:hypothetical protein